MRRRPERFYRDFDVFLSEVTRVRSERHTATSAWVKAVGSTVGVNAIAATVAGLAGLAVISGPLGWMVAGVVGAAAAGAVSGAKKGAAADADRLRELLRRAERKFEEAKRLEVQAGAPAAQALTDELFDSLVQTP